MAELIPCRRSACSSCPYRLDVPSGLWSAEEYVKLPPYDAPTWAQPQAIFMCHQSRLGEPERVCRGWLQVHRDDSLAVRLGVATGQLDPDEVWADTPGVAYHPSGQAAADHGLARVDNPDEAARRAIERLTAAQERQR